MGEWLVKITVGSGKKNKDSKQRQRFELGIRRKICKFSYRIKMEV